MCINLFEVVICHILRIFNYFPKYDTYLLKLNNCVNVDTAVLKYEIYLLKMFNNGGSVSDEMLIFICEISKHYDTRHVTIWYTLDSCLLLIFFSRIYNAMVDKVDI